jgi:hypothetical protein
MMLDNLPANIGAIRWPMLLGSRVCQLLLHGKKFLVMTCVLVCMQLEKALVFMAF